MKEDKPCSFCGETIKVYATMVGNKLDTWCVQCDTCKTRGPLVKYRIDTSTTQIIDKIAVKSFSAWNKRAQ